VSSVPMPRDLSEDELGRWVYAVRWDRPDAMEEDPVFFRRDYGPLARAVRALVEATGEKVARQAYHAGYSACVAGIDVTTRIDADVYFILARVLGDHPKGGHEAEGREAPRA